MHLPKKYHLIFGIQPSHEDLKIAKILNLVQVKIEPFSPPSSNSHVTPIYSTLTSESSDNNDQDHAQTPHELDNFITLQQQL